MAEESRGRRNLSLTDQEWDALGKRAEQMGLSRSAVVGQFALGQIREEPDLKLMEAHAGSLRLRIKSVQSRKVLLRQELEQLDEEELELRRLLANWEEAVQRISERKQNTEQ
ncbi:MAG: hypothetical protein HC769_24365 [Cyanobacteria bacterium CRU_2_1]|nr:hypothetical protein [Cyanobacteria bacterium RU_5_0]NJR61692.1 hypothetical protein [Cyanobacteria bacterium CRU_2_1]